MSSTIGDTLRLTLFGRSHGPVIGMTLAGIPAGKALSPAALQAFLDRRAPGRSPLSTARREADIPRFLSGLNGGVTTGEDITAVIENTDVRSADYEILSAVPRPGHADYTAYVKYGRIEPGGGPFSGRMTAALCIAGGICLQLLEQAGISPKEVQWVFLGPVDAKVALLNGSVDAWATWEPYTTQMVKTNEGQILVSGKGLLPGNTFLAATDSALNDPQKRAALQDYLQRLAGAERWAYANLDSYGKTLGEIIRFPVEIARAQFANRQSQWQPLAEETVTQQQATADFYLANGLIRTRLDVKPTFDPSFSVPAAAAHAEVTP